MPEIDRPQLTVSALGSVVRIVLPPDASPELVERVAEPWRGALIESTSADREVVVDATDDVDRMLEQLSVRVTLEALDHRRGELIMLHAAGIALDDGRVIAFVGPSGRGKTTLSRELGKHFGYVSDETIGVDADLNVFPYRKPLSVVQNSGPKKQVAPAVAGLRDLPNRPLRLAALVLLDRDSDAQGSELEPVGMVEALVDLVPQLSYLSDLETPLRQLAHLVDGVGGVRRLRYREASEVADLVQRMSVDDLPGSWCPAAHSPSEGEFVIAVDDGIVSEDRIVVLSAGVVRVLSGIAPTIWDSVSEGSSFAGIVEAVTAVFGEPPAGEARAIVAEAIDELVGVGVLRRA